MSVTRKVHTSLPLWALATVAGCASNPPTTLDSQTAAAAISGAIPSSAGAGSTNGSGFEATVQPFINMACNCHQSSPILMAPFSLKPGEAYKAIVNVPSMQLQSMLLVKPGSTQDSYLWHKVNNTHLALGGSGQVMPSTIPLNAEEKKLFERWILGGALP